MPILAVDLGLINELLAEVAENPPEPESLAARMAAALQVFTRYTSIVDIATLRSCTQTHEEYTTLDDELQDLEDTYLRATSAETLLQASREEASQLRAISALLTTTTA